MLQIKVRNHQGKVGGSGLPLKWSLEGLSAEETANPGTFAAILSQASDVLDAFRGVVTVQDGVLASYSLGASEFVSDDIPTAQTHEERVVLTYRTTFTNGATPEVTKFSVFTPDLTGDWPFPTGVLRVHAADSSVFSAPAEALIENVREYIEAYGFFDVDATTFSYADLVGGNI